MPYIRVLFKRLSQGGSIFRTSFTHQDDTSWKSFVVIVLGFLHLSCVRLWLAGVRSWFITAKREIHAVSKQSIQICNSTNEQGIYECVITNTHLPGAEVGAIIEEALGDEGMAEDTVRGDSLLHIPSQHRLQQLDTLPPLVSFHLVVSLQTHLV